MKRHFALMMSFVCVLWVAPLAGQEVCSSLLKNGYYDQFNTFSDRQRFQYIKDVVCRDQSMTKEQAMERKLDSGGSYYEVISGFLNLSEQNQSFQTQFEHFCHMSLDTSTASDLLITHTRTVSHDFMEMVKTCFDGQTSGYHAIFTPAGNLDGFTIQMINKGSNGQGDTTITVKGIVGAGQPVSCAPSPNGTFLSGTTFNCTKSADKTMLVTMNTNRGGDKTWVAAGKDTVIPDMQNQLQALSDKVRALESRPPASFDEKRGDNGDICRIFQDFQICWGSTKVQTDTNQGFDVAFVFANEFDEDPKVVLSAIADDQYARLYALSAPTVRTKDVTSRGGEVHGWPNDHGSLSVLVSYIAIGKPHK